MLGDDTGDLGMTRGHRRLRDNMRTAQKTWDDRRDNMGMMGMIRHPQYIPNVIPMLSPQSYYCVITVIPIIPIL